MTDYAFHNVTRIQVDALRECIDFIRNGYVDMTNYYDEHEWYLYFKKSDANRRIKVIVRPFSYVIEKNGKVVKSVEGVPDDCRYNVSFDSDVVIKADLISSCR